MKKDIFVFCDTLSVFLQIKVKPAGFSINHIFKTLDIMSGVGGIIQFDQRYTEIIPTAPFSLVLRKEYFVLL